MLTDSNGLPVKLTLNAGPCAIKEVDIDLHLQLIPWLSSTQCMSFEIFISLPFLELTSQPSDGMSISGEMR